MAIRFYAEGVKFRLPHPRITSSWLKKAIAKERRKLEELTFIFCSDSFLLDLNVRYLRHNTLTDILTFDLSDNSREIRGEIYISIDRVVENAIGFEKEFDEELHRVLIHGILHLTGYNDKTASEKAIMRKKEEAYLSLR